MGVIPIVNENDTLAVSVCIGYILIAHLRTQETLTLLN